MTAVDFKTIISQRPDYGMQFEILVSAIYRSIVKTGDCVVDGGANAGLHAVPLARLVGPTGSLHSFEPNPPVSESLARSLQGFEWAIVHQRALWDQEEELEFVVDAQRASHSHVVSGADAGKETIRVKGVTLDETIADRPVTFIKLDLEGADFRALRGARRILAEDRPVFVFENSRGWAAKCYGYTSTEFFRFFREVDYRLFDLHGRELTQQTWGDKEHAFEYVGLASSDARLASTCRLLTHFWETASQRRVLTEWRQCVGVVRNLEEYWPEVKAF